jgi:hypothetical protein
VHGLHEHGFVMRTRDRSGEQHALNQGSACAWQCCTNDPGTLTVLPSSWLPCITGGARDGHCRIVLQVGVIISLHCMQAAARLLVAKRRNGALHARGVCGCVRECTGVKMNRKRCNLTVSLTTQMIACTHLTRFPDLPASLRALATQHRCGAPRSREREAARRRSRQTRPSVRAPKL